MCASLVSHKSQSCQNPHSDPRAGLQLECESRLAPYGIMFWQERLSKVIGPVLIHL